MARKTLKLKAEGDQARWPQGHGGCIASDMITVRGKPVGFMYRETAAGQRDGQRLAVHVGP